MVGSGKRVKWHRNFAGRMLSPPINSKGYPYVYLRNAPKYKNVMVHRLVGAAFIPNPKNLPEINHIDGCKTNNVVANLEWTDRLGNHTHGVETGLIGKRFVRKLSDDDVREIVSLHAAGAANTDIAGRFGVNQSTISRIVNGVRRVHRNHATPVSCLKR